MNAPVPDAKIGQTAPAAPRLRRRQTAGRGLLIGLIGGSLVAASLLRGWLLATPRFKASEANSYVANKASIDQFDSYTLGLLLGGLRGPLVMTLWASSEAQKSARDLEAINTKIELIRLLQPEFDSVHLFQIWNKAFNLSVQMANLPTKYATILDAIEYANATRAGKQNVNLETQVGSIFFDKFGNATEKAYYRQRVRDESMAPRPQVSIRFPAARRAEFVTAARDAGADPQRYVLRPESGEVDRLGTRLPEEIATRLLARFIGTDVQSQTIPPVAAQGRFKSRLDPVLDDTGRLLERRSADNTLLVRRDKPQDIDDTRWTPEFGELQYLTRFEPFPLGVSPNAFAYNYFKRALAVQTTKKQSHAQLSDRVVSSRPALALAGWTQEELELGRAAELTQSNGQIDPNDASNYRYELATADFSLDPLPSDTPLLLQAVAHYDRANQVAAAAIDELRQHIARYADDFGTYGQMKAELYMKGSLAAADAAYVRTILATDDASRRAAAREAATHYVQSADLIRRILLAYYIPDEIIQATFPPGRNKLNAVGSFDDPTAFPQDQIGPTLVRAVMLMNERQMPLGEDFGEFQIYLARVNTRLQRLSTLTGQTVTPAATPATPVVATQPPAQPPVDVPATTRP